MKHLMKTERRHLRRLNKKAAAVIALVLILVAAGTVIVFAALGDTAGTVTEELGAASVTCEVNSDYSVTNTGNIPALIRVRVVINKTDGGDIIPGETPAYTVAAGWTQVGDYIYYNDIVSNESGSNVTSPAVTVGSAGSDIQVMVLAEAIQAASDAKNEWGATFSGGSWS